MIARNVAHELESPAEFDDALRILADACRDAMDGQELVEPEYLEVLAVLMNHPCGEIQRAARLIAASLIVFASAEVKRRLREMLKEAGYDHTSPAEVCASLDRLHLQARESGEPPPDAVLRFVVSCRRLLKQTQDIKLDDVAPLLPKIAQLDSFALASCDQLARPQADRQVIRELLYDQGRLRQEWHTSSQASEFALETLKRLQGLAGPPNRITWWTRRNLIIAVSVGAVVLLLMAVMFALWPARKPAPAPAVATSLMVSVPKPSAVPTATGPRVHVYDLALQKAGLVPALQAWWLQRTQPGAKDAKPANEKVAFHGNIVYESTPAAGKLTAKTLTPPGGELMLAQLAANDLLGQATEAVVFRVLPDGSKVRVTVYGLPQVVAADPKQAKRYNNPGLLKVIFEDEFPLAANYHLRPASRVDRLEELRRKATTGDLAVPAGEAAIAASDAGAPEYAFAACCYLRAARSGDAEQRTRALEILRRGYELFADPQLCRLLIAAETPANRPAIWEQCKGQLNELQVAQFISANSPEQLQQTEALLQSWVNDVLAGRTVSKR